MFNALPTTADPTPTERRVVLLGLNHKTAPLAVRERFAFDRPAQISLLNRWRAARPADELVLLSTCNRVELYAAADADGVEQQLIDLLAAQAQVPSALLTAHAYRQRDRAAAAHLFSVAASLDSMLLGEHQILGQVRDAYELSQSLGATGPALNPLFQRALAAGKDVFSATTLGDGRVSIAGVAVHYAQRVFDQFEDKTLLCIGAGKMALLALRGLAALHPRRLIVCNRDVDKAQRIAADFGGAGAPLDQLDQQLAEADIVITSTGAAQPIIRKNQMARLMPRRRYRPIFLIDIAVPRDVEADVATLDQVYLCNLDDLQTGLEQTQQQRGGASSAAGALIEQHVDQYWRWHQQRALGPMIAQLYQRLHAQAGEEVNRLLQRRPNVTAREREELNDLARRMVNKFLHDPIHALQAGQAQHGGSPARYLHAIEQLFNLAAAGASLTDDASENTTDSPPDRAAGA